MNTTPHITEDIAKLIQYYRESLKSISKALGIPQDEMIIATLGEVRHNRRSLKLAVISMIAIMISVALIITCVFFAIRGIENIMGEDAHGTYSYPNNIDVTMIELISKPEAYHGKFVRVTGVGYLSFEANFLYLSKEDQKYWTDNCIWIELSDELSYDECQKYNGKYVFVEGYFNKNYTGHMGAYCGSISDVSRYELHVTECMDIE